MKHPLSQSKYEHTHAHVKNKSEKHVEQHMFIRKFNKSPIYNLDIGHSWL